MVFSHAFAGAALTQLVLSRPSAKISKKKKNLIYFIGISAAILPDLDIALLLFDNTIRHRTLLSHSLMPYVLITLMLWIAYEITQKKILKQITVAFLLGSLSHILLDTIAGGVALWAPFTYKLVGFPINFPSSPFTWIKTYITSKYMLMEFGLFLLYLNAIKRDKNVVLKGLPIFLFIVATTALFGLALFIY